MGLALKSMYDLRALTFILLPFTQRQDFKIRHEGYFSLRNQVINAARKSSVFVYVTAEAGPTGIYALAA
jgi:hypothetical protein